MRFLSFVFLLTVIFSTIAKPPGFTEGVFWAVNLPENDISKQIKQSKQAKKQTIIKDKKHVGEIKEIKFEYTGR